MHPADFVSYSRMQAIGREEGLVFPIGNERWHGEPKENPTPGKWGGLPRGW